MPNPVLSPVPGLRADGSLRIETGTSRTRAYVGARRAVTFSYRVTGALAGAPTVELVSASDGATVKTWAPARRRPGRSRACPGTAASGAQPRGRAATPSG